MVDPGNSDSAPEGKSKKWLLIGALLTINLLAVYFAIVDSTDFWEKGATLPGSSLQLFQAGHNGSDQIPTLPNDEPLNEDREARSNSFLQMMGKFPWADAVAALNDTAKTSHYTQLLLDQLSTSLLQEPIVAPRPGCHPPPLMQAADIQCSKYPHAFTPKERREKPVKVAHLIQMGFDADMLEVLLHELDDVVDKFFVIESTRTHNKDTRKILMWDRLKYQSRFDFVKDKVVHLVLDDSETLVNPEVPFARESLQEKARWDSFLSWNKHSKYFGPEDLVGFGDTDEIPARSNVQLLRHCTMAGASVDIGSWFAPTRLDEAFRPDWPVPGHPWTLGDPTYWTVASATEYGNAGNQYPSRMRGMSGKFLLGGIHMTDNGYFPMRMAKLVACTECSDRAVRLIQDMASYFQDGNAGKEVLSQLDLYLNPVWPDRKRFVEGDMIKPTVGAAYHIPWFLKCNPDRYASWYRKIDSRVGKRRRHSWI